MVSENFEVEAETAGDAMRIAEEKYASCEFVLAPGNLVCRQMAITTPSREATEWVEF